MNNKQGKKKHEPILAIDPTVRGFGYVIFEGPRSPIEWGTTHYRVCKNKRCLARIKKLITMYQPETIVIEQSKQSLRCERVKDLLDSVKGLARKNDIAIATYTREQVLETFGEFGKRTKHEIAQTIAEWLPELAPRLPSKRRCFETESEQYGIFDAAALALAHMYLTD